MATLNDLRTKGGWIIAIIVAVSMVAFLLGDFFNSGASMATERKMRVGEINGENIGYTDFYNRVEELSDIYTMLWGASSFTSEQYDAIYDGVWQQYFMENIYTPGFKKMGLNVSEAEQVDMLNGTYISPVMTTMFTNPTTGVFDQAMMMTFLASVESTPQYATLWSYLKRQMTEERQMSNFVNLVAAGFNPNELDVNQAMTAANDSASGKAFSVDYLALADSLIMNTLSDNDVKEYYNNHKNLFKQTDARTVNYVVFDVLPTDADFEAAASTVAEMAAEFAASETPLQYATLNSQESVDANYYKEDALPAAYVSYAFGEDKGKMYGPILMGNTYTMARLAEIKNMPDSLNARHILLAAENESKADSIVTLLRKGADFAALATEFSIDEVANLEGGELGMFAPEQMVTEFSDACINARVGQVFTVKTSFGTHIVELLAKSASSPKAQFATIVYNVDPSEATQQEVYNKANAFLASAGNTVDGFNAALSAEGLTAQSAMLSAQNRSIVGLDNSKELVRWAFNGKQGDVSTIFDIDDKYIVASIPTVVEEGYAPIKEVSAVISRSLKNEAKAKYVAEQIEGLSIEAAAEKFGVTVSEVSDVQFNSYIVENVGGMEPKFIGAFSAAKAGAAPAVVDGVSSIIVYQVDSNSNAETMTYDDAKVYLESYGSYYLENRIDQAIFEESKIVDNRAKYF
ncbi:MAG: SurA N-terminal domain-containing protein [Tidjanibacter sp.]|nr:SurA N-terminal domain-containing protein [Tidjanibacter sp.]